MRYIIATLGCKVNQYESEAMELILRARGHEKAEKGEADVITDAAETEAQERPRGISLYFLQKGESAWDIARRYRIPVEEIGEMNPDFSDAVPGTPVIIYKK